MLVTVPITEKNPFTAQANATYFLSESFINDKPIGNGIPRKNPRGNIIAAETKILHIRSNLTIELNTTGLSNPIATDNIVIIIKIKINLFLLLLRNLKLNILPMPDAISIVAITVSKVITGCPKNKVNFCTIAIWSIIYPIPRQAK